MVTREGTGTGRKNAVNIPENIPEEGTQEPDGVRENVIRANVTGIFGTIAMSKTCSGPLTTTWTIPRSTVIGIASSGVRCRRETGRQREDKNTDEDHRALSLSEPVR
jgi:hypothetical protein